MNTKTTFLATVLGGVCLPALAMASTVINFETGYTDDQLLNTPIELLDENGAASGVTLDATVGTMSIEAAGNTDSVNQAFVNDVSQTFDTDEDPMADLDGFFLRTTAALSADLAPLDPVFTLSFATAARSVSAEIWDIDGTNANNTEQWRITAHLLGGSSVSIDSFLGTSNDNNLATSRDGLAWEFSFVDTVGITAIDFDFIGTKTQGIGVAFDNLEVAPIPLPAAGWMLLAGLAGLGIARRKA